MDPRYWYVGGVAYDFTPFMQKHPGGQYALDIGRGQECEGLLATYHLNIPSRASMEKYKLPDDQQPDPQVLAKFAPAQKFTYEKGDFYDELKKEVRQYFKSNKISHKAPWSHVFMVIADILMILFSFYYMVAHGSYLAAIAHGFFRGIMVVQATHGASHFAFSKNPMVNRWLYRIGTVLIGLWCPKTWDMQHILAHHIYTNEWPYDSDSAFPIKSIAPNQRRFGYHKYQHIYMWVVYTFTIPLVMLNSIRELAKGRQVTFKMQFNIPGSQAEAWACTIGSVIYVYLAFAFLPFFAAAKLTLVTCVTSSLFFSLQFVVNHEVEEIYHDTTPEKVDFGAYQVMSSLTFAPDSTLALELSGGLNTQVEHHLFPGVYYSHYKVISQLTRQVAAKYNIKYHSKPTLLDAIVGHYRLLKNPPKSIRSASDKPLKEALRNKAKSG